jgi:hypothetical protein
MAERGNGVGGKAVVVNGVKNKNKEELAEIGGGISGSVLVGIAGCEGLV